MISLTSDYSTFYSLPPLPSRLLPFARKSKYPPYGLRKVEAIIKNGKIVPPNKLADSEIIGIYVNDPLGLTEVAQGIRKILGEEPGHVTSFKEFYSRLKDFKGIKIAGGPGAWEVTDQEWIDHIIIGEAEKTLPLFIQKISNGEKLPKVIYGEKTDVFYPIKGPSAMAEVEVMRKDRKVPLEVVKEELKIQSKSHGYVNLISNDLFAYGEGLIDLLRLSFTYGKVIFSNITHVSSLTVDLGKVKEVLSLSENNWRSPVLSSEKGSCIYKAESEVLRELNKNFIYPMIYVTDEERVYELMKYKTIIIPLPSTYPDSEGFFKILYDAWMHDKQLLKIPFSRVIDFIMYKTIVSKGEYLRKVNLNGIKGLLNLLLLALKAYFYQ